MKSLIVTFITLLPITPLPYERDAPPFQFNENLKAIIFKKNELIFCNQPKIDQSCRLAKVKADKFIHSENLKHKTITVKKIDMVAKKDFVLGGYDHNDKTSNFETIKINKGQTISVLQVRGLYSYSPKTSYTFRTRNRTIIHSRKSDFEKYVTNSELIPQVNYWINVKKMGWTLFSKENIDLISW